MEYVLCVVIGLLAGTGSGLFGIGGGVIIVPLLVYLMGFTQHKAQGTSLGVFLLPVGILGAINYYNAGNVDVKKAGLIAIGLFAGSFVGSKIALNLDAVTMRRVFAAFLVLTAIQLVLKK